MGINEVELGQLCIDVEAECTLVNTRRRELRELLRIGHAIEMTSRIQVTPAVMSEDKKTITTPEISEQIFDVKPIDLNLNETMNDERRQEIYDYVIAKKASLGF